MVEERDGFGYKRIAQEILVMEPFCILYKFTRKSHRTKHTYTHAHKSVYLTDEA